MSVTTRLSLVGLLTLLTQGAAQIGSDWAEVRSRLVNGLSRNDRQTFAEVAKLPIDQAAPLLLAYVDNAADRERAEQARKVLRKMPGFSDYMKQRILEKRKQPDGEYHMSEFRMLRAIGGNEAAAAVAPFLFLDDPPLLGIMDDYTAGPVSSLAFSALVGMQLPDAPRDKKYPEGYSAPDFEEWKSWAEKKGYRDPAIPPLMTLEQKGVSPDVAARSNAIWLRSKALSAEEASGPPIVHPHTTAPTEALSTPRRTPTADISSSAPPATQRPTGPAGEGAVWPWVVGVIAAVVVTIAFALKRR